MIDDGIDWVNEVKSEFPVFSEVEFTIDSSGWDYLVLIADGHVIFRIPRREADCRRFHDEILLLDFLAPYLPLPVPRYCYRATEDRYAGYEMIQGISLQPNILFHLNKEEQVILAHQIGLFLSALHSVSKHHCPANILLPIQKRDTWMALRDKVLLKTKDLFSQYEYNAVICLFDRFDSLWNDTYAHTLIHGDFSAEHILFDAESHRIRGVIDFGDTGIGDPAYDLAGIYLYYGKEFLDEVLEVYFQPLDVDFLERIEQFYIPKIPLHLLLYGIDTKNERIVADALEKVRENLE